MEKRPRAKQINARTQFRLLRVCRRRKGRTKKSAKRVRINFWQHSHNHSTMSDVSFRSRCDVFEYRIVVVAIHRIAHTQKECQFLRSFEIAASPNTNETRKTY